MKRIAKIKNINMINIILILSVIFIMIMLIYNPVLYIGSVSRGLYMFAVSVLPSLFPFFVLTKTLTELGDGKISKILSKPVNFFFRLPPSAGYIFTLSVLSGYPVGAKLTLDFYEKGVINSDEARRISSFCSTSGPFFIIGTVGASMLVSIKAGYLILIAHILSALCCGLIFARKKTDLPDKKLPVIQRHQAQDNKSFNISETIYDSVKSILIVGGFICIFYMVIDILLNTGLLIPLDFLIGKIFTLLRIPENFNTGFTSGLIEVTRGCLDIAALKGDLKISTALCCGIISFGGLCINMQALAFLNKCKVSTLTFLGYKIAHMVISVVICLLLCLVFM